MYMKRRFFFFMTVASVLISLVFLFSACQTLSSPLQEPVVSVNTVEFVGISFTDMELLFQLKVENPNNFEIPFPEIHWELFLNENTFLKGEIRSRGNIRARTISFIDVPVNLNFLEVFSSFSSLRGRNSADYRIAITARIPLAILRELVFNLGHEGQIPLPQVPSFSMPSMRVENSDLSGVTILVSVNVENPNIFDLPPPRLSMEYSLNNSPFFSSTMETESPLRAGSVTPIAFRFSVRFADVFLRFINLRNLREVSSQLSLSFDFATPAFLGEQFNLRIPGTLPLR